MELEINGKQYTVPDSLSGNMLVWVIRDELGLTGTKFGCGLGICGSCVVHVDGEPVRSCITPASSAAGKSITTIEGLAEELPDGGKVLHPVQQAFLEVQAPQCGWCMSGQMMTAAAFLAENPDPTDEEIATAMNTNYCRCGTYVRIKKAVQRAAELGREAGDD